MNILTRSLFFTIMFTLIFSAAIGIYFISRDRDYSDKIYPNVYVNGISFEGKTRDDVRAHFEPINEKLSNVAVEIVYKDTIATFSGSMLDLRYNADAVADQAFMIGRSSNTTSMWLQRAETILNLGEYHFAHKPSYNLDQISQYLTQLDDAYSIPPQNALFEFDNGRVTTFRFEKNGQKLQIEDTKNGVESYLSSDIIHNTSRRLEISETIHEPDITIADINEFGIQEKIGEGQSDFSGSSAEREHNIAQAAARFHGVLIPPGDVFSFNRTVGDISRATGYKTSYVIKNGRTVLGDGGGVCQDSTTLFRAALNTGLPIIERHAHAYRVKYYENDKKPGFDATVFSPSVDLKFKNDTENHILIQSFVDHQNNILRFEFFGTKDGRTVELSDANVYGHQPAPAPLYEDDPSLPAGVVKQVDWAAPGAKSSFTYKVVSADGEIIQDKTFYSSYRPWQAVFLRGIGP